MRSELRDQIDDQLGRQGGLVVRAPAPVITTLRDRFTIQIPAPPPRAGGSAPYVQVLDAKGKVVRPSRTGWPGSRSPPATRRWRRARRGATRPTAPSTVTTCG